MKRNVYVLHFLMCIFYCAIGLFSLSAIAQGWNYDHWPMMGGSCGMWGMGIFGWIIMILVIVVLFLATVWLIKQVRK